MICLLTALLGCVSGSVEVAGEDTGFAPDPSTPPPTTSSLPVCINEFMSANGQTLQVDGAWPDWIELHNPTAEEVSLEGWTLSDDSEEPKAPLDGVVLPAGGFVLLYADGVSLPFGLDQDGEELALLSAAGVGSRVTFPALGDDVAATRVTDCCEGPNCWITTTESTPGTTNTPPIQVIDNLVVAGATWHWYDAGPAPDGWNEAGFDDSSWPSGPAPLGYGDPHIVTQTDFGPNPDAKRPTAYFRTSFQVSVAPQSAELGLLRDDGAVVYLDGAEILRDNLPAGIITPLTLAEDDSFDETAFFPFEVDPASLGVGTHVLAVEVHQAAPDSSDLGLDLTLEARREEEP